MCLVGEDHQVEVGDPVPEVAELVLELVERLAGVRAGVHQGERLVLDQVAVDAPDRERRRDAEAVDAGFPRPLEGLARAQRRIVHEAGST